MSEKKTIFEGLYQIDWSQGSLYDPTTPYEIPNALRDLLSNDDSINADAHIFLFSRPIRGPIELDEIRFHIIRFCLELLDLSITPAKVGILDFLQEVISARNDRKLFRQNTTYVQSYTRVYEILEAHIPLFFKLLEDHDRGVCFESLALLTAFKDRFQTIVPHLMVRFECENDLDIQMSLLKAVGSLLIDLQYFPDIKHCGLSEKSCEKHLSLYSGSWLKRTPQRPFDALLPRLGCALLTTSRTCWRICRPTSPRFSLRHFCL